MLHASCVWSKAVNALGKLLDVPNPNNNLTSLKTFHDTIESQSHWKIRTDLRWLISTNNSWEAAQGHQAKLGKKLHKQRVDIFTINVSYPQRNWNFRNCNSQKSPITAAFLVDPKPPRDNKPHDKRPQSCVFCKGRHTANQCTFTDHNRRLEIVKQTTFASTV